jgi:hypothetical protein
VAYINVSGTGDFATLHISTATISGTTASTATGILNVSGMQNVTLNNGNGTFRWKQLDSTSEYAVAIAATNQISLNVVLDSDAYFGATSANAAMATARGLFNLSNDKALVYFRLYYQGTGSGDKYVSGSGYLTGLSPTVSPDSPVWTSPLNIDVVGDFTAGSV